jgi:hypothetical protein
MKKISNWIVVFSIILIISYLIIDILHFVLYRVSPNYPTFTEAFFESTIISIIKWILSIFILIGVLLDKKSRKISFYIISTSTIGIILLFFLKGQFNHLIRGSIVFKVGILEIASFLMFVYAISWQIKKYRVKPVFIILDFILTIFILGCLFYLLPIYKAPYF